MSAPDDADNASAAVPRGLHQALQLAYAGVAVFPCSSERYPPDHPKSGEFRKHPLTDTGFQAASSDPAVVRTMWERFPDALIGIPTGAPTGLAVVDLDTSREDGTFVGQQSLHAAGLQEGVFPYRIRTPRGGMHLVCKHDPAVDVLPSGARLHGADRLRGVDVRADGGYIVCWDVGTLIAAASDPDLSAIPQTLIDAIDAYRVARRQPPPPVHHGPSPDYDPASRSIDEAEDLLFAINPACDYQTWIEAMMAVHAWTNGGSDGLDLVDRWSAAAGEGIYAGRREIEAKWRSFRGGGINAATLAALARSHGADLGAIRRAALDRRRPTRQAGGSGNVIPMRRRPDPEDDPRYAEPHSHDSRWPPFKPLGEARLPKIPLDGLPDWLADFSESVSASTQTAPEMSALFGLSALAGSIGNKIALRWRPGNIESLNIYSCVVAPPSERKTSVMGHALAPIYDYQDELTAMARERHDETKQERRDLLERAKHFRLLAVKAEKDEESRALREKARNAEKEAPPEVEWPDIVTNDATSERLASLALVNDGRMILASSEGGILMTASGAQYGRNVNIDSFLKMWDGEPTRTHRQHSKTEITLTLRGYLTFLLSVQPNVIAALAKHEEFVRRGFLSRFIFAVPDEWFGQRDDKHAPVIPERVRTAYRDRIRSLLSMERPRDPDNAASAHFLSLAPDALEAMFDAVAGVERRSREDDDPPVVREWVGKFGSHVRRIAGLLHCGSLVDDRPWEVPVERETMLTAIAMGKAVAIHARHAFDLLDPPDEDRQADAIWTWIRKHHEPNVTTVRDVWRSMRSKASLFPNADAVKAGLYELEDRGYLRLIEEPVRRRGRQPSPKIELRPDIE